MAWVPVQQEEEERPRGRWVPVNDDGEAEAPKAKGNFFRDLSSPDPTTHYSNLIPFAREQNGVVRMGAPKIAQDMARAFTAPVRAMRGEMTDEQMLEEGRNFTGAVATGGLATSLAPKAVPVGVAGMNAMKPPAQMVSKAMTAVAQPVIDRFGPDAGIGRMLAKRIQQQYPDVPFDDAVKMAEARMAELGPEAVLADLGGSVKGLADTMVQTPGKSRPLADEVLGKRAASEGSRMVKSTQENYSGQKYYDVDDEANAAKALSGPHYEAAYEANPNVTSEGLKLLLEQEPLIKAGIRKGLEIQRLEASTARQPFRQEKYGVVADFNEAGEPVIKEITATPLRLWHAARKGLDGILEGYRDKTTGKLVLDERGRKIRDLRKSLDEEIKDLAGGADGDFAKGDAIFADAAKLQEALNKGRSFATGDEEITEKYFKGLSPQRQEAFRAGVAREISGMIRKTGATPASLRNALKDTGIRDKLKVIAPTEAQFNKFVADLEREEVFRETNRIRGGSQTASRLAEDEGAKLDALGKAADIGVDAGTGNFRGAAVKSMKWAINAMRRVQMPQETRDRVGKMLLSQDPKDKEEAFALLKKAQGAGWVYAP
jgi:hypothetical protein